jgi:hypothetical protein
MSSSKRRQKVGYTKENPRPEPQDYDQAKQVVDVLLQLLRRADDQVRTSQELGEDAKRAVEEYKSISASLAVKQFEGVFVPPPKG